MPSNIRTDFPISYDAELWLAEKVNKGGVTLPETSSIERPTAEWANNHDAAVKQVNEAFNGVAVNASNVGGLVRFSRTATSDDDSVGSFTVLSEVPANTMVAVEVTTYAVPPLGVSAGYGVLHTYVLARTGADGTVPEIIPVSDDVLVENGGIAGLDGALEGAAGPPGELVFFVNGGPQGSSLFFDVSVRSFPEPLNLPTAIQE